MIAQAPKLHAAKPSRRAPQRDDHVCHIVPTEQPTYIKRCFVLPRFILVPAPRPLALSSVSLNAVTATAAAVSVARFRPSREMLRAFLGGSGINLLPLPQPSRSRFLGKDDELQNSLMIGAGEGNRTIVISWKAVGNPYNSIKE